MWRFCAPFVLLVALLGCSDSPSQPGANVPFTLLSAASIPGSAGPQIQTVVRSDAAWSDVWFQLWGPREPARPPVDFSRDMVIVVTGSETCFGGAVVEEIVLTGPGFRVRYGDAAPSLCLCAQPELSYQAVRAPRVLGEAVFEARQTPPLCPN